MGPSLIVGHPRDKETNVGKYTHWFFCETGAASLLPTQPSFSCDLF